jgi:DNA-directed RNA polymerase specialized sigma24 family protein
VAGLMRKMAWQNVFFACAGIICLNFLMLLTYKEVGKEERLERKRLRDERNRQAAVGKLSTLSEQVAPGPRPYLFDVLDGLPERERTAVVLRYYAGLNASEIGTLFECPAGTVRSLLHRALKELERVLS